MLWLAYIGMFVAGFGLGAWRAGSSPRGSFAIAALLPLVVLLLAGLMVLTLSLTAKGEGGMKDLAYIAVAVSGCGLALLAWAGGLFGVWWRRAGRERQ